MKNEKESSAPEDEVSPDTLPIPQQAQDPAPSFTGEQVKFLMSQVLSQQGTSSIARNEEPVVKKRNGSYDRNFGWMHLTGGPYMVAWLFIVVFAAYGAILFYPMVSSGFDASTTSNPVAFYQPFALFGTCALILLHCVVKWRRSHLLTTKNDVRFVVEPFWPLFILTKNQVVRIKGLDVENYKRNFIEEAFSMNSCTLTLDTAATKDKGMHYLKGVKDIELLEEAIG